MKILIVSDAWYPQLNGVVRTLQYVTRELGSLGHQLRVVGPEENLWNTTSAPSYPSIKLEFFARPRLRRLYNEFQPDFVHIATEGPLGWAARNLCLELRRPFTTSYHTRFPEYLAARMPIPLARPMRIFAYAALRRFHAPSSVVMVATASIETELKRRRFRRLGRWSRGVDTDLFKSYDGTPAAYKGLARPLLLYVGRVAVEKNLHAFLNAHTPGTKIVIGDGPDLELIKDRYAAVRFLGAMEGEALARHYAAADLFVFPSTTDTFGLVLLEACAAGLRIASLPAPGPVDIFADEETRAFAVLDEDMEQAIHKALALPQNSALPRAFAERFSWAVSARQFYALLQAPTPKAIKRITRFGNWLKRWWQHALALIVK